jgi:hypothetical protein
VCAVITATGVLLLQTRIATRAYKLLATLTKAYVIPKKQPNQGAAEAAATAGRYVCTRRLLTVCTASCRICADCAESDTKDDQNFTL